MCLGDLKDFNKDREFMVGLIIYWIENYASEKIRQLLEEEKALYECKSIILKKLYNFFNGHNISSTLGKC